MYANTKYLILQPPVAGKCSLLPVHYYHVRITSKEGEILSEQNVNATTLMFKYLENQVNITFIVNIAVVDIKGLKSVSLVATKTISSKCNCNSYL